MTITSKASMNVMYRNPLLLHGRAPAVFLSVFHFSVNDVAYPLSSRTYKKQGGRKVLPDLLDRSAFSVWIAWDRPGRERLPNAASGKHAVIP
jgi:hypothetical protein